MRNFKNILLLIVAFFVIQIANAQTETKVYATETGAKYHKEGCRYLAKSKYETTKVKAKNDGYTVCKVCKPGGSTTNTKAIKTSSTSSQCTGKTQAGNRCKRMTKSSSSGKCYQH